MREPTMENELPVIVRVPGLGDIVELTCEFSTQLQRLHDSGARLIDARDEAYARLQTLGKENIGQVLGTRTSAGFEYAKGQLPLFRVRSRVDSPAVARRLVEANTARRYYSTDTTAEYEESALEAAIDLDKPPAEGSVVILPSRDPFIISDKKHWDIYEAVLKDQARPYFEYNGPIPVYPICKEEVDSQNGTILTVLWFRSAEGASILYGYSRNLNHDDRARGVIPVQGLRQD